MRRSWIGLAVVFGAALATAALAERLPSRSTDDNGRARPTRDATPFEVPPSRTRRLPNRPTVDTPPPQRNSGSPLPHRPRFDVTPHAPQGNEPVFGKAEKFCEGGCAVTVEVIMSAADQDKILALYKGKKQPRARVEYLPVGGTILTPHKKLTCEVNAAPCSFKNTLGTGFGVTADTLDALEHSWGGACSGTAFSCNPKVNGPTKVTLTFTLRKPVKIELRAELVSEGPLFKGSASAKVYEMMAYAWRGGQSQTEIPIVGCTQISPGNPCSVYIPGDAVGFRVRGHSISTSLNLKFKECGSSSYECHFDWKWGYYPMPSFKVTGSLSRKHVMLKLTMSEGGKGVGGNVIDVHVGSASGPLIKTCETSTYGSPVCQIDTFADVPVVLIPKPVPGFVFDNVYYNAHCAEWKPAEVGKCTLELKQEDVEALASFKPIKK